MIRISKLFLILIAIGIPTSNAIYETFETPTLSITQVNEDGFGDVNNNYAFAMEPFKGSLYVATLNCITLPGMAAFFVGLPFQTDGVQIWKGDKASNGEFNWEQVVDQGNGNKDNFGIRKLYEIGDYMYAVTSNHVSGFEIWRTSDGLEWTVLESGGFGDTSNLSGRGLFSYNGFLYVGVENRQKGAKIFRRAIQENGEFANESEWVEIISNGGGDSGNWWFSDFVEFKGYMYAGTLNTLGFQLYRTLDGVTYERVISGGNGAIGNSAAMDLYVYNDRLFVGTMNFFKGTSLFASSDVDGVEFEAIYTDGNGDSSNAYTWYMQEFNDRLYVGTFKTSGQFDLYSAKEPGVDDWIIETNDGFGYEFHYGIRSMTLFEDMLMIGDATARVEEALKIYQATPLSSS